MDQRHRSIPRCNRRKDVTTFDLALRTTQRLRDMIGLEIGDGTPEIMKAIIARETFGREFSPYE